MTYTYKTKGTCSTNIELEVEDGIVRNIAFWGGCNGNLQGLSRLVAGMPVKEVISRLEGIRCGGRPSCVRHCTRWGIDSAALIEGVRGRDDFLGTDYADFTERKSGKAVFSVRVYSSHEVDKFVLRDEFIRLVG